MGEYRVSIVGPGLNSDIIVREAADLEAVQIMLAKVEKSLTVPSACTSEPFVCCGATGFRPCPTFEASCKNPANYGFPFARRVNAVLATRGLCLDASQLAALIQDPPTPHRAGAETYDEHRQNAIDDASRYEEAMAHALTNAFGLLRRVRDRVDAVQFFEADAAMKLLEEVMAARRMPHEECCGQGCAECQPPHPPGTCTKCGQSSDLTDTYCTVAGCPNVHSEGGK